jgi:hypothetical protein
MLITNFKYPRAVCNIASPFLRGARHECSRELRLYSGSRTGIVSSLFTFFGHRDNL